MKHEDTMSLKTTLAEPDESNSDRNASADGAIQTQSHAMSPRNWWTQECGVKEVLTLALPLVVSMLSYALMNYCNRLFLTWHSTASVAAVIQAGVLSWVFYSFPLGLTMYTTTFVAQYFGAGQWHKIGRIVWQAIWIGVACVPLLIVAGWQLPEVFARLGHTPTMLAEERTYFHISLFGLGTATMAEALTAYFVGVGRTRVVMFVNGAASLLNIGLDYVLIFGFGPMDAMGIAGAAWATNLSIWFKLLCYAVLFATTADRDRHALLAHKRLDLKLLRRLLRFGAPQGFHFLLEGLAITMFIMIMGGLSEQASAATAIAFSANLVAFVPVMGLGTAVTTLVGREVGHRRIGLAQRATRAGLGLGITYSLVFALLYFFAPLLFVGMHGAAGAVKPEVTMARWMLQFVAAYCIFDAVQLVLQAALKGAGDTRFIMGTSIVLSSLFVACGGIGANCFSMQHAKILWWWWMLTAWIVALSAAFAFRYRAGQWKTMQVIEPDFARLDTRE
jgi:MATE family multidrug resistance protein